MTTLTPQEEKETESLIDSDIPDAIQAFMVQNGIKQKFHCTLEIQTPSGGWAYKMQYRNEIPLYDKIGKEHGPGTFRLRFLWRAGRPGGGSEPKADSFEFEIAEHPWMTIHKEYLMELRAQSLKVQREKTIAMKQEAEIANIENGAPPQAQNGIGQIKDMITVIRELGIPVGGAVAEQKDTLIDQIIKLSPIIGPMVAAFAQRAQAQSDLQLKLMLGLIAGRDQNGGTTAMFQELMGVSVNMVKQAAGAVQMLSAPPEEKESMMDRVFGLLDKIGPTIIEMAAQSRQQREQNLLYSMAKGSREVQTIAASPELQKSLVERLDREYGFQEAEEMLKVLADVGIGRPPELMENWKTYPSKGYDTEGNKLGES